MSTVLSSCLADSVHIEDAEAVSSYEKPPHEALLEYCKSAWQALEGAEAEAGRQAAAHTTAPSQTAGKVLGHFLWGEAGGQGAHAQAVFGNARGHDGI